jgi:hypothetical protein
MSDLKLLSVQSFYKPDPSSDSGASELHIMGEIMNNSTQPRDYAEIAATFYDASGKMVGWAASFTAAKLESGSTK